MAVNLTPGAISKILTGKCTENDLYKPVLQVIRIDGLVTRSKEYQVCLSDGSFFKIGYIPYGIFISNKLQKGSIVQLTNFQVIKHNIISNRDILVYDLNLLRTTCNIIGDPKQFHIEEIPTSKQKQDHVNLTPGAIAKIMTENIDLKPVLQLSYIKQDSRLMCSINGKQWYAVLLSDGSSEQVGFIADEMIRSKQLQIGSIAQLTKFQLFKDPNIMGEMRSGILVSDLTVIHSKRGKIGDPKLLPVERTAPTFPDEDQIHANSHHVEEPPTSVQNPATQKCSSYSITQNNTDTMMGVNLTPVAITKIMTDKCSSTDLKPVVQVTNILSGRISSTNDKQCYRKIVLSDGSSSHFGCIADDIFISNKLQKGSIVQLTKFQFTKFSTYGNIRILLINDLNVIHSKCDIVDTQESFPRNDIPLVERSTPPIPDEDYVDVSHAQGSATSKEKCSETQSRKRKHQSSNETLVLDRSKPTIIDHDHSEPDTNEDVDNSHPAEEPSATTQKCSSHSLNQSKKRKRRSSNNNISKVVEDVSKMTKLTIEKIKTVEVGFKRLETLEEDVSKMAKMMEKNKKDDVGACFKKLESLEEDVSKMTRMMMEKNKEVDVGYKKLETLEEDVSKMTKMMEKNKEDDVGACFKKLETLEEDVSKMTRMMMEKNKEVDVGYKKFETLEEDVSKMTRMMMEKNKEVDVGYKKLETLEENVSKLTRMMMEKNKEDDVGVCFKKLETLEENVSKLTRMTMEKNKEDDMGACIEKLDKIGWVAQDPMYDTAILLFGQSADYRKLWLHLKPESCGNWVKNAGSMFGLLD